MNHFLLVDQMSGSGDERHQLAQVVSPIVQGFTGIFGRQKGYDSRRPINSSNHGGAHNHSAEAGFNFLCSRVNGTQFSNTYVMNYCPIMNYYRITHLFRQIQQFGHPTEGNTGVVLGHNANILHEQ